MGFARPSGLLQVHSGGEQDRQERTPVGLSLPASILFPPAAEAPPRVLTLGPDFSTHRKEGRSNVTSIRGPGWGKPLVCALCWPSGIRSKGTTVTAPRPLALTPGASFPLTLAAGDGSSTQVPATRVGDLG